MFFVLDEFQAGMRGFRQIVFGDDITRCWKQVISYEGDGTAPESPDEDKPSASYVEEDPGAFQLEPGEELIRDERGVRIARPEEEGD